MTTRHKPQPWYAALNQPPRSPKDGKYRRPPTPPHRGPIVGTDPSTGTDRTTVTIHTGLPTATWRALTFNSGFTIPSVPEPPGPSIPYAGVRAGEIIGHRIWVVRKGNALGSIAHDFIWTPGAVIEGKVDEVIWRDMYGAYPPIMGGVYCFATQGQCMREVFTLPFQFPFCGGDGYHVFGLILGTIKCWGEVIAHERGFRAQFARIHSIDSHIGPVDIEAIRKRYLP